MTKTIFLIGFILIMICAPILCPAVLAASLRATAVVERIDLFVGEPFIFQIQVAGSENPQQPDLSHLDDFAVEFRGGQQNSRRSVTIVNGKVTQNVQEGYFFSYQLTPNREGRLIIPSITVFADGHSTHTEPLEVNAKKPVETDDFKLSLRLSKDHCYVGEPITLTVVWYIGKDVKSFNFTLPLLNNDAFDFASPQVDMHSGKKLYRIPLADGEVIGEKGRDRIGAKDFATITFEKILIPKQAGNVTIEPATVACSALVGYENRQGMFNDDFFSDFFNDDFFGRGRRGIYRTVVVPSNSLSLRVSDLPEKGRPANFAGHVGEYRIAATAAPTEVSVGDPVTLTLSLGGPEYLDNVKMPLLDRQPNLVRDFKIPKERAAGEISGKSKKFTQTIRALKADVKEIPSIELPYFDTRTGAYSIARTEPIPLTVKKTRVVTVLDAEGNIQQARAGSEIETWSQGIAFNYEDMSVIENQRLGPVSWLWSPLWMGLTWAPPVIYLLLLAGVRIMRRRSADPFKNRARKAYGTLTRSLKDARSASSSTESCSMILNAFRDYLGDKLRMGRGAALTFNDVKNRLASEGVDQAVLDQLKAVFERCEAGRYAGNAGITESASMSEQGIQLAKEFEKKLK